uniref:Fas-binding factor 1 C-terminal domain-containing protein n=2 Tax=Echeneis naucrates TaxID=173247 RepID=A0A665VAA2_ECHNA
MLAEEIKRDGGDTEDSDVSAADPNDILKNMKDMDDLDADLFASKTKSTSAPAQTKHFDNEKPKKNFATLQTNGQPGGADEPSTERMKPNSASVISTARSYKQFTFSDLDDPVDELLGDENKPKSKISMRPTKPEQSVQSSSASPVVNTKAARTPADLTFDDGNDDHIDALGIDNVKSNVLKKDSPLWNSKERGETPPRARTRLDEFLESLTSPRPLEQPPMCENQPMSQKTQQQEKTITVREPHLEDDLTFGSYQPTVASTLEGRLSRRQSVRFSTEDVSDSTLEKKSKTASPTSSRHRSSADWLGLKTNDDNAFLQDETKATKTTESPKVPSSPLLEKNSSPTPQTATENSAPTVNIAEETKPEFSTIQKKQEEEGDDWLAGALNRKKALSASSSEEKSKQATSQMTRVSTTSVKESSNTFLGQPSQTATSTPVREESTKQGVPEQNNMQNSSTVQQQVAFLAESLQQLLQQQQMMQSQLLGRESVGDAMVLQTLRDKEHQLGDYKALQTRIVQLEGLVKTLQLERDQSQILLESVQQRHKQDMELMENTHKARVKLLEESASQRDARSRQEYECLMERLATVTRSAEQERSVLQAQYQHKLAQAQQDRDCEVERLRELQRKSILEMKKDHEDQVQRLKRLKDEEIDAVTSATSQTRSLTVVIEQMEQFSSRLGELSSRVESTHEHTTHGLEQGARHRDEQLRILQDRLAQQQKAMAEERAYLKEIISRLDTQLMEQQRQPEKEQDDLKLRTAEVKQKQMDVALEQESLTKLREELDREKERINSIALRLRTRSQEVEAFSRLAADKYEEGERALEEAKRVEAGHEARFRNIQIQTERLRQQEQRILQERVQLIHLQETERLRQDSHATLPQIIPPISPDSAAVLPNPELVPTLNIPPISSANISSMALQAGLALWKYVDAKDREYLEEQQIFLEDLKKKSYRSSFNTD